MLPTLQLVFLDRTEGPLGLRLLQLQVISIQQEKKRLQEIAGKARERETQWRNLGFKMCSGGARVLRITAQCSTCGGRNAMSSKTASLTTVLVSRLFLLPCLLRLRNQRFSFMLGMVRFVRVMRVL
jgi:hypothetical protein